MSDIKFVALNGPPWTGKDTAAMFLAGAFQGHHVSFKGKLIRLTREIFDIGEAEWEYLYQRERKEISTDRLRGHSPRTALIHVSEDIIKPNFGSSYFGESLAKNLGSGINFCSDSGFAEELHPIIDKIGSENVAVVRLLKKGCSFENDSRDYLRKEEFPDVWFIDIINKHGKLPLFLDTCEERINQFLEGEE